MCRVLRAVGLGTALLCLVLLLASCPSKQPPAPSYLAPYEPALKEWTPEDETAWESLPRYDITATLDLDALTLSGEERVRFTNREAGDLTQIGFRLYPNLSQQGGELKVQSIHSKGVPVSYDKSGYDTSLIIRCEPPLKPNQVAELDLDFTLTIPNKPDGYALFGRSQNMISLPDFYPILAVHNSQGWHTDDLAPLYADAGFADSAFYHVWLTTTDPLWVVVTTGNIITQTRNMEGNLTTEIVTGPIREFTVIASPDYEFEATQAYGTQVRSYFLRQDRSAGLTALERAASALRVYSDSFGPYPFTEMSVVEAPLEYHGMEYSTLNMLGVDTYRDKRDELSYLVIHETAHQWWYSQVGNDPYNAPWLDEGLAEYSAYTYFLKAEGRQTADTLRDQRWVQAYTAARDGNMDTVLAQKAPNFPNVTVYEIMVYAKAALFFDALRRSVGDEMYESILREYVRRYRFQTVMPEHFFAMIQEVAGRDPTPLINEWILTAK